MPRSTYHSVRWSIQYWCSSSSLPGSTKYSISICSNSRVRKMKLPGVISLRKLLPTWPMPNGGLRRAVERADMAGRDPDLAGQDHRAVEADDVLTAGDHELPPLPLDVLLELHAQRAVVPRGAGAAVDLPRCEDESAPLGERDDFLDL